MPGGVAGAQSSTTAPYADPEIAQNTHHQHFLQAACYLLFASIKQGHLGVKLQRFIAPTAIPIFVSIIA